VIPPKKTAAEHPARTATAPPAVTTTTRQRKPWVKRTPIEVIIDQIAKVRDDVMAKEEELKQSKKQLQKLEEVQKALEST
jgi:hypothetical protein